MFDFDVSKMIVVGVIALVVVGPKELPAVLRALGQVLARLRRFQTEFRSAADKFIAEADVGLIDRELEGIGRSVRNSIAINPATAMRGSLPSSNLAPARVSTSEESLQYASPEMQAYLAPLTEGPTPDVATAVERT